MLKLEEMKKYAEFLKQNEDITNFELEEDNRSRYAIERALQLALQSALDIGEIIIAKEDFEKPEKNKEVIEILGKKGVLKQEFSEKFAPSMGLRNILVHKYGEIDTELLKKHIKEDSNDFEVFSKSILEYLEKK